MRLVDQVKQTLALEILPGDFAIDATMGNGYDTLFLAECVGPSGKVIALDIQAQALQKTKERLENAGMLDRVQLALQSHADLDAVIPESWKGNMAVILFNLGYLPGGDKTLITTEKNTLIALEKSLAYLKPKGLLSIMLYPGHEGGKSEADAVLKWVMNLGPQFAIKQKPSMPLNKKGPAWVLIEVVEVQQFQ